MYVNYGYDVGKKRDKLKQSWCLYNEDNTIFTFYIALLRDFAWAKLSIMLLISNKYISSFSMDKRASAVILSSRNILCG